jgi:ribonuclease G
METRVAVVDDGLTQDVYIERRAAVGLVGNIYVGKVKRILPGTQSAFVDIGVERNSFIHISDIVPGSARGQQRKNSQSKDITDYLHDGKKIIVQVTQDPVGTKGARVTMQLSVSTRYLVLQPQAEHTGVSHQIVDSRERARLQQVLAQARESEGLDDTAGFVLRTAAEGVGLEEIASDLRFLQSLWAAISRRAKAATKTELLYEDLPLHLRMARDIFRPSMERVIVDNPACFLSLQNFCADYTPTVKGVLEQYSGEQPLFELYGVEAEIQCALDRRVELGSGGYLIFDQTEAMAIIDVNTGSYIGKRNQCETILQTNLEAVEVLARQLRLRNLGGIIIVDFINMEVAEHRRQVHDALKKAIQHDPAGTQVAGFSKLGLVEMTRKRTRESLEHLLCEGCPVCQRRGVTKTAETVCYEIFRQILRDARSYKGEALVVLVAEPVAACLLNEESGPFSDLQRFVKKTISVRVEQSYKQEHFDIRPL